MYDISNLRVNCDLVFSLYQGVAKTALTAWYVLVTKTNSTVYET